MSETRTIDMLFLELSQFTKATTAKELELQAEISRLADDVAKFRSAFNKQTSDAAALGRETDRLDAECKRLRTLLAEACGIASWYDPHQAHEDRLSEIMKEAGQ